jgi:hypothetical protein
MSQSFTIELKDQPAEFIKKAKSAVEKAGGTLNGDERAGNIAVDTPVGDIHARYEISGSNATIHIDKKPMLLAMSMIKSALTKYLS